MKKGVVRGVFLLAASTLAFAQLGPGPAVPPLGQGELRPHVWIKGFLGKDTGGSGIGGTIAPSQIKGAYGITGTGAGATVAIVDANNGANVAADRAYFVSYYGITCPSNTDGAVGTLTIVNETGGTSLPAYNSGWEVEINLDTQYVTAIAPCANITLVEATTSGDSDLLRAVQYASSIANVVSMSWGGSEFSGQTSYDSYFATPKVTFLASSGDTGGEVEWPSSSVNVIAVGGTNLTASGNAYVSETAWSGSGGGCSTQEPALAAQSRFLPASPACSMRAVPDVAMDGGSAGDVAVYISEQGGWFGVYGTSLAVQLWAGVIATANGSAGTPLNGTLSALYANAAGAPSSALYTSNYNDITSGSAGSFSAGPGWDFVTGLGSPKASSLLPDLTGPNFSLSISPSSQTVAPGSATGTYTVTATALNGFSLATDPLSWSYSAPSGVTLELVGSPSGSSYAFTLSSATSGTYAVTITGSYGSLVHSVTATVVVSSPTFSLSISPTSRTVTRPSGSKTTSTTYTVTVTDAGGFSGDVTLSVAGGTTGVTPTITGTNPVAPGNTGTVTVTVTSSAKTGTLTLTVMGVSGSISKSATATITVSSFLF